MDKVIYTDDYTALQALMSDEDNPIVFTHTPFKVNGNEALALVRGEIPDGVEVLGTYEEIFADSDLDTKYKSVWDYEEDISVDDGEGGSYTYNRPQKIGEFA